MVRLRGSGCFLGDSVLKEINKDTKWMGIRRRVDLGRVGGELGSGYDQNRLYDIFQRMEIVHY